MFFVWQLIGNKSYVFFAEDSTDQQAIVHPENTQLIQWMYAQYKNKLSRAKQNKVDDSIVATLWNDKKVTFKKQTHQDTVYWATTNPKTGEVYQIRYDGKLRIQKQN